MDRLDITNYYGKPMDYSTPKNHRGEPMDYHDARADLQILGMFIAGFKNTTDWTAIRRDEKPLLTVRLPQSNSPQELAETLLNALVCGIIDGMTRKWNVPYPKTVEDRNELVPGAMQLLEGAVKGLPIATSQDEAISALMPRNPSKAEPGQTDSQQGTLLP